LLAVLPCMLYGRACILWDLRVANTEVIGRWFLAKGWGIEGIVRKPRMSIFP